MALLNTDKSKQPQSSEVPDELPSLPTKQEKSTPTETTPPPKKQDEHPAELPEIHEESKVVKQDNPIEIHEDTFITHEDIPMHEEKHEEHLAPTPPLSVSQPIAIDKRQNLFFNELLNILDKTNDPATISSKLLSEDIVDEMKKHFKEEKLHAEIDTLNAEIKEKAVPLRTMELQWQKLNREINIKQKELRNLEKTIENKTEELKSLILKFSQLRKKSEPVSE